MRGLVLVVLWLGGCDRVFGLDHKFGPIEDLDDASGADVEPVCGFATDTTITSARWWVPDATLTQAARVSTTSDAIETGPIAGPYTPAFVLPATHSGANYPALSADAGSILMQLIPVAGGVELGLSTRAGAAWTTPEVISVVTETGSPMVLGPTSIPGAITATGDRRMMITMGDGGIDEVSERGPTEWRRAHHYPPSVFAVNSIHSGNLSADGLSLVFAGAATAGAANKIYLATRASVEDDFEQASELYTPAATPPTIPYLAVDCSSLFFVSGADARRAD